MVKKAKKSVPKKSAKPNKASNNGVVCAVLSYLVIGIIWYFVDDALRKDAFVNYHVKQGLAMIIAWFILMLASMILWFLSWLIIPVTQVLLIVWALLGIINAVNEQQKPLFLIGKYAEKMKF